MWNLIVVGHFSTALIAAWLAWVVWLAWQLNWFRRLKAEAALAELVADAAPPAPAPARPVPVETSDPKADPITLRAPGAALRSMAPAPPRPAAPAADAGVSEVDDPPIIGPPPDREGSEPTADVKPFE